MGRKTKRFIDKKKSSTFQLLSRDSTDPNFSVDAPGGDRIFVRVDNSPLPLETFGDDGDGEEDPNSIFADAPEDDDSGEEAGGSGSLAGAPAGKKQQLPEHVRKEILELGFPDDGYNYLLHLREIRKTGGGSAFFQNPKTRLDLVPKDVKAYDASRVTVPVVNDEPNDGAIYDVASGSVNVRVQKALDPEVAALLDDSDLSRFGSDVEDLEEDFVLQANCPEPGENSVDRTLNLRISEAMSGIADKANTSVGPDKLSADVSEDKNNEYACEKPRARRLIDEQFDLLQSQEYGLDYDDDDDDDDDPYACLDNEEESLADKLKHSLHDKVIDDLELEGDYKSPADFLREKDQLISRKLEDSAMDLIHRCRQYAEKYEEENEDDLEMMSVEESSDKSEAWDCETILSTYSNLDNHPAKIEAPVGRRKRLLSGIVPGALAANNQTIILKGKEKLPVDFLHSSRKPETEKVKGGNTLRPEQQKTRQRGQESKEEKKERKAVVKEERREARRTKKEMKGLYRCEAQHAQRVAASTGPSSIPLM